MLSWEGRGTRFSFLRKEKLRKRKAGEGWCVTDLLWTMLVFPGFEGLDESEAVRAEIDPLLGVIPPHWTLVVSFAAEEAAVRAAMEAVRGVISLFACFELEMRCVERRGEFWMLLPERGGEAVRALHNALCAGAFAREDPGRSVGCTVVLERMGAGGSPKIMERFPINHSGGQKNEDRCEQLQFSSGGVGGADEHL